MSPHVAQTRQLRQLRRTWPKKEIAANSADLANFDGLGQFILYLAKVAKAAKVTNVTSMGQSQRH
jgi:hypothetical protein